MNRGKFLALLAIFTVAELLLFVPWMMYMTNDSLITTIASGGLWLFLVVVAGGTAGLNPRDSQTPVEQYRAMMQHLNIQAIRQNTEKMADQGNIKP